MALINRSKPPAKVINWLLKYFLLAEMICVAVIGFALLLQYAVHLEGSGILLIIGFNSLAILYYFNAFTNTSD